MLTSQTRRVRTVHLTAPREDLIRRGALLLEDALHTASLPEASSGRLLVVRSLHVGTIRADQSAAALSLTIEHRLRELALLAVHASDPAAPAREVIYFRDDVEPSIMLALRLAHRQSTAAWFWRLAVPVWKAEMSIDDALRTVFFTMTQTKAGLAAAIRLAQELAEHDALDALLTAIRLQDGSGLLHAFGWSKLEVSAANAVPPDSPAPVVISARWRAILARWIPRWGSADARAVWLAGVALAADNPLRLLNPDVMAQAARLIASTIDRRVYRVVSLQTPFENSQANRVGRSLRLAPTKDNTPVNDTTPPQTHADILDDPGYGERHSASRPVEPFVGMHGAAPLHPSDFIPAIEAPESALVIESSVFALTPWPDTPLETYHAGLFFLIPVLARLGIAEFLTPELIEAAFPLRLLGFIGQHLGLSDDDPVQAVLATDAAYDPPSHFVTPESWQKGIANPGTLILRRGAPGKRALFDASGRLPLAQWQRHMPEIVRDWVRKSGLRRHPYPLHGDLVLHAWLTATRRWLRRHARLGLANVVLRAGRITATRTHIDLFFDLDQADIRVRRVGLDIDPGWIPWLGRVLYFHYEEQRR